MSPQEHARIMRAVEHWLITKDAQGRTSKRGGQGQEGRRAQVTAAKHLDGLNQLIIEEIQATGAADLEFRMNQSAALAGWYRSSKAWDLLVFQHGTPILAVEYKSMSGSEGKNLNNRADEVFGIAEDAREAEKRGILPPNLRRAYIFLMEATPDVTRPVKPVRTFGNPDVVFHDATYLDRMAIMCERIRDSGLYHLTWAIGVTRHPLGFAEPNPEVGWDRFASDLRAGFVGGQAMEAPHP